MSKLIFSLPGFPSGVGVVSVFSLVLRAPTLWTVVGRSGLLSIQTAADRVGEGCITGNEDVSHHGKKQIVFLFRVFLFVFLVCFSVKFSAEI